MSEHDIQLPEGLQEKISQKGEYGLVVMTQSTVDCMLAKLGKDAELAWSDEYLTEGFQAYANPDDIEEGEAKVIAWVFLKHNNKDYPAFVSSTNESFAQRIVTFLKECGEKTGSGRRKSKKNRKTKKSTRRR